MTALFISLESMIDIKRVVAHAIRPENRRINGVPEIPIPGDDEHFVVEIPMGFKAVFSIDGDGHGNWMRHLSVSVSATQGRTTPSRHVMDILAKTFGFSSNVQMGILPPDPDFVIHAVEPFIE